MLRYRILTAIILIPIFIALVIKLPPIGFCLMTALVVLLGAWEWSFFMGVKNKWKSLIYPFLVLLIMLGSLQINMVNILYASVVWWILAFLLVLRYPKSSVAWGNSLVVRGVMGAFVLVPSWLAINFIRINYGIVTLLFLFVLIWGADIGAYFVGRAWGKHKLAPAVSPGKTREGLSGALAVTLVIALAALYASDVPRVVWIPAIILSLITVLFSVLGDLFESMLKRNVGLKDSGQLLPGHGGILDRIDSLTAAAPVFTVGAILLGKIFH